MLPPLESYHILPGDVLAIAVWGEDQLTQACRVNGSGTISYPLLGDVPAAGATCSELEGRLREDLREYLRHPQVSVTVREYGALGMSVFVLGEVEAPGIHPLVGGTGLMQALASAGGATPEASGTITIVRARTGEMHSAGLEEGLGSSAAASNAVLEPGDVIVVNRKPEADMDRRYAVLGAVPTPGMFAMPVEGEVRVLDAMEKAGLLARNPGESAAAGRTVVEELSRTAELEHALLTRSEVVVPLNLAALLEGDTSQNLLLQSGDVLTVPRRSLISVYASGEVRTPGRQMLPPDATVLDLLNVVGGVSSAAKLHETTLLRVVEGEPKSVPVDLNKLLRHGDPEANVPLQQGDVLFVPARGERGRDMWTLLPLLPYLVGY
jgi:polysaccharide export outer membrane protein